MYIIKGVISIVGNNTSRWCCVVLIYDLFS